MSAVTLRQLAYAVGVADHGHFGRAADALHISQPGLSAQIRELERRLGVALFERLPRGVRCTPAGEEIVARARQVLRDVADLELVATGHVTSLRGPLRVAAIPTTAPYLLPPVVRTLRAAWPDADLHLAELQTATMVEAIEHGDVDLGLLATPFDTGRLHVEELVHEPFVLALPRGHPLAGDEPAPVGVLQGLSVLLLEEGHCLHDHAKTACALAGRADDVVVESASLSTLSQMVAAGIGVTLLPTGTVALEARPGTGIVTRAFTDPAPGRTLSLVWRPTDPRRDRFAALCDRLRAALGPLVEPA